MNERSLPLMLSVCIILLSGCAGDMTVDPLDTTAPTSPAGLTATAVSQTRIDLAWSASTDDTGVTGYRVYRGGTFYTTATGTGLINTGLTASTQYCYTVSAVDAAGNESAQTASQCATTLPPDTTPPTTPTGLTPTVFSSSWIHLVWSASTDNIGVTGYRVYRDGSLITTAAGLLANDMGLSASTQYCYTVAAVDAAGNESAQTAPQCATTMPPDTTPPTTPGSLTATAVSSSRIDLTWSPSTDNVAVYSILYRVYRGAVLITTVTGTGYSNAGLVPSTQYCYTVVAEDRAGNVSAPTASQCATTLVSTVDWIPPSVPTGLYFYTVSSSTMRLEWTPSTDNVAVTGYRVYRNGSLYRTVTGTGTGITDSSVTPLTTYCYTVSAIDAENNESGQSSALCATATGSSTAPEAEPNDTFATAQTVTALPVSISAVTSGTTHTGWPPVTPDLDRYAFTPVLSQPYTVTLSWGTSGTVDMHLDLFDGTQTFIGGDSGGPVHYARSITMMLQAGSTYYVVVVPYYSCCPNGRSANYTLTISP